MHEDHHRKLLDGVLTASGDTDEKLRSQIVAFVRGIARGETVAVEFPEPLRAYLEAIAYHAHEISDADVEALRAAGYSDDALFEITVAAAVAAGLGRMDQALGALRGRTAQ